MLGQRGVKQPEMERVILHRESRVGKEHVVIAHCREIHSAKLQVSGLLHPNKGVPSWLTWNAVRKFHDMSRCLVGGKLWAKMGPTQL